MMLLAVCCIAGGSEIQAIGDEATASSEAFVGDWAMKMNDGSSGWLSIGKTDGKWTATLWRVGQQKAISDIRYANGQLTFTRQCRVGKPEYDGGPPTGQRVPCGFVATVKRDAIRVEMTAASGEAPEAAIVHVGKRLPPMPPQPDLSKVKFGEAQQLFNGRDLTGWVLSNPKQINGWKAIGGVLVNESPKETFEPYSRYGNLRTVRMFGDGKLSIDFNVPAGGNSGIYVRGAYEVQVTDRDSRMQGIQGVGSVFGRVERSTNAGKPGGEWQNYEITVVDRHMTVVLNGKTVIDNQPVIGNTNGAFQADVMAPGPLYLQGDHTAVKYRNILFQPVR